MTIETLGSQESASALAGLRVVDIGGSIATAYCAKLFADYGAEVINLEPEQGFATRKLAPLLTTGESALHGWLHAKKSSVVANQLSRTAMTALLGSANLLLDDGNNPQWLERGQHVRSTISWFGAGKTYEHYVGSDGICFALNGMLRTIGRIEGPPLIPTGYQAQIVGGNTAFIGSLGEVLGEELGSEISNRSGSINLETSILEAMMCFTEVGAIGSYNTGLHPERMGVNRFPPTYPMGVYPCKDGWLGVTALTPSQWHSFCELLDMQEFAHLPLFQTAVGRLEAADLLEPMIEEKLAKLSSEEVFYRGQQQAVPLARVPTMEELFQVDQFVEREAFTDINFASGSTVTVPGTPFRLFATPPTTGGRVASLGAQTGDHQTTAPVVPQRRSVQPQTVQPQKTEPARAITLHGIRILDLSMGWAGPLAARHLADMGADVIKIESCERFDWWRSWEATPEWIADNGAEKSERYNAVNRNKRNVTLDLESTQGRELFLQLVARADAVIENFSGSVLPKLGLDYATLKETNPNIILVSMPAFGTTGPWQKFRAYGSTVEQASGLPHMNGFAEDRPTMQHVAYGDAVGGLNGASALLVALRYQARTGKGQQVDLSQVEGLFPLGAHGILHQAVANEAPPRTGNLHPEFAPHGVYACQAEGPDESWLLIQVFEDSQWQTLKTLTGDSLAQFGSGYDNAKARVSAAVEIDSALAQWCKAQDASACEALLQSNGIPTAVARRGADALYDSHLNERHFWQWRERVFVGNQPNPSAAYQKNGAPIPIASSAPTLGQHNTEVLGELLGLSHDKLIELAQQGVIGTKPRMPGSPN